LQENVDNYLFAREIQKKNWLKNCARKKDLISRKIVCLIIIIILIFKALLCRIKII
jgi:hypothetical protein